MSVAEAGRRPRRPWKGVPARRLPPTVLQQIHGKLDVFGWRYREGLYCLATDTVEPGFALFLAGSVRLGVPIGSVADTIWFCLRYRVLNFGRPRFIVTGRQLGAGVIRKFSKAPFGRMPELTAEGAFDHHNDEASALQHPERCRSGGQADLEGSRSVADRVHNSSIVADIVAHRNFHIDGPCHGSQTTPSFSPHHGMIKPLVAT